MCDRGKDNYIAWFSCLRSVIPPRTGPRPALRPAQPAGPKIRPGAARGIDDIRILCYDTPAETYAAYRRLQSDSRIREICASAAKAMAAQLSAGSVISASFEEPFGRHAKLEPLGIRTEKKPTFIDDDDEGWGDEEGYMEDEDIEYLDEDDFEDLEDFEYEDTPENK